jgi:predicted transcriptional regulator
MDGDLAGTDFKTVLVYLHLAENGPQTPEELNAAIGDRSLPSIYRALNELHDGEGIVERTPAPDVGPQTYRYAVADGSAGSQS